MLIERHVGTGFAQPVLRRIATAAGGNPLYALEIARALRPDVPLEVAVPLPVPDNLRELVARRVAALPDAARTALLAAAALTHPSAAVVETVSSQEALAAAEVAGLLRVERGQVRFAHPLYASAVYASAATHDRRARCTGVSPPSWPTPKSVCATSPSARRARTLPSPRPSKTRVTCARSRGAWETAGELLELAHTLTPPRRARRRVPASRERRRAPRPRRRSAPGQVDPRGYSRRRIRQSDAMPRPAAARRDRIRERVFHVSQIDPSKSRCTWRRRCPDRGHSSISTCVWWVAPTSRRAAEHADAAAASWQSSAMIVACSPKPRCAGHGGLQGRPRRRLGDR